MPHVTSIGLDVHARSAAVAAFNPFTGEVVRRSFSTDAAEIAKWALGFEELRACYESGPTGFHMAREPRALGLDCAMAAVSKMQRPAAIARRKNDRRDAEFIARMLATHSIVEVPLPDIAVEDARDLERALDDATRELHRSGQRLNMFPIRPSRPSEHSSGKSEQLGGITKAGNALARTALIESARHYSMCFPETQAPRPRHRRAPSDMFEGQHPHRQVPSPPRGARGRRQAGMHGQLHRGARARLLGLVDQDRLNSYGN